MEHDAVLLFVRRTLLRNTHSSEIRETENIFFYEKMSLY
jgi:hypothetical protein